MRVNYHHGMILKNVQNRFLKKVSVKGVFLKITDFKNNNWIKDQLWKRDGIYGEPYEFSISQKLKGKRRGFK